MESSGKVRLYVSDVCFRNQGRGDELFNMFGRGMRREFGAYLLCCAFADSSATYRSIVENFADRLQTGIVEMSDLTEGDPAMLDSMKHLTGVYTDGNLFTFSEPMGEERPCRKPGKVPCLRVAYVKFKDGTARRYYAITGTVELCRKYIHLFAERYGMPIEDIVSVREVGFPRAPYGWYLRLLGSSPGHLMSRRQLDMLLESHQDMGLYRF